MIMIKKNIIKVKYHETDPAWSHASPDPLCPTNNGHQACAFWVHDLRRSFGTASTFPWRYAGNRQSVFFERSVTIPWRIYFTWEKNGWQFHLWFRRGSGTWGDLAFIFVFRFLAMKMISSKWSRLNILIYFIFSKLVHSIKIPIMNTSKDKYFDFSWDSQVLASWVWQTKKPLRPGWGSKKR